MPRSKHKIVPILHRRTKDLMEDDRPQLAVILADLKKILVEDGLLPQHKH
jgi:hypothetical protein